MLEQTLDRCQLGCEDILFDDTNEAVGHYEAEHDGVIYIDTREKDDEILSEVTRVCDERNIGAIPKKLDSGDYVYHGDEHSVAIEYKGISDAVNSALNDRLYRQANRMAQDYDRAFVFIVGKTSEVKLRNRNIGYGQAYGQILGVIPQVLATMNMPVQWLQNEEQFADVGMRTLIDAGDKGLEDNQVVLVSPGVADDTQMGMLMSINGVGRSSAKDILEEWGSLRDVKEAEYYELLDISGIGPTTARKIWNTFNRDWDGPGFDANDTSDPMWDFFETSGVSEDVFCDIWGATDGMSQNPWSYIEDEYEDMGPHRYGIVEEAIEEYLEAVDSPHQQ